MFTPASLREIAAAANARYEELRALHPSGSISSERNEARHTRDQALACAIWMERMGHAELAYVGPFGEIKVCRGSEVIVNKGALVTGTHPRLRDGGQPAKASRRVRLHGVLHGYVDLALDRLGLPGVRQPQAVWAGAGGYWHQADLNDTLIPESAPPSPQPATTSP